MVEPSGPAHSHITYFVNLLSERLSMKGNMLRLPCYTQYTWAGCLAFTVACLSPMSATSSRALFT